MLESLTALVSPVVAEAQMVVTCRACGHHRHVSEPCHRCNADNPPTHRTKGRGASVARRLRDGFALLQAAQA